MRGLNRFFTRLHNFSTKSRGDERLREEIESHIALQTDENIRIGMAPHEARRQARLKFGSVEASREGYHAEEGLPFIENLLRDIRFAARTLQRSPGFSIVAILTLVVGIGGVTAVFSIVDSVLLRPLPYPDADRLVVLHTGLKHMVGEANMSAPDVLVYQRENKAFTGVAGFIGAGFEVSGAGAPFHADAQRVNASMFPVLGVTPLLGRTFTQQEDENSAPVVVISFGLWKERFQSSPGVIGKTIDLDRRPYTIIGVMPRDFETPSGAGGIALHDIWVPMSFTPTEKGSEGTNYDYGVIARLKPGISLEQAKQDVERVLTIIQATNPQLRMTITMRGLKEQTVSDARPLLRTLLASVALILLIASANLANLMLVRAAGRQREFGVRLALGAGRRTLLRQLLTETFLLSAIGGALGFTLTVALIHAAPALLAKAAPELPRVDAIAVRWPVAGLALVLICLIGVLCGLAPGWASLKANVLDALREGGQAVGQGRRQHRLSGALVVTETALAMLLLVGSGLLLRSFSKMLSVNPGFQADHVMTASLSLPLKSYPSQQKVDEFLQSLGREMKTIPGIQVVGFSTDIPVVGRNSSRLISAQDYVRKPNEGFSIAANYLVAGDYFRALRIPLIQGRDFDPSDDQPGAPLVAIVSQSFARRYFSGRNPIGMGIKVGPSYSYPMPVMHVVGVVGDVSDNALDQKQDVEMYEPLSQGAADLGPMANMVGVVGDLRVAIRTEGDPKALEAIFARVVRNADPLLAITDTETMDETVAGTEISRRFSTGVLTAFAAIALLLALLGIYGVVAYTVVERTREIAIRMALGATRANVLNRTLRQALLLGVAGVVVGLTASVGLTRYLSSLLYGVEPLDFAVIAGAAVILLLCALSAGWLPARRASSTDPMQALRIE